VVPPPCSEFSELLTLLDGVDDCCTAPFSFVRPFEFWKDDCDPATPVEPSLVLCALSAFFLLLKRNDIVPFEGGNLLCYANLPPKLFMFAITRNSFVCKERFEVLPIVGQEIFSERTNRVPARDGWGSAIEERREGACTTSSGPQREQNRRTTTDSFLEVGDVAWVVNLELIVIVGVGGGPGCRSLTLPNNSLGSKVKMGRDSGSTSSSSLCLPDSLSRFDIGKGAA
jgi:hypothetical protein